TENLTIRARRDGGDLVLSVAGSGDPRFNGEYFRAPVSGPGGKILSLTIRGGPDNETFQIDGNLGLGSVTIDGRGGNDTLFLNNSLPNNWTVTGPGAGVVGTNNISFRDIENLKGGSGRDVFAFAAIGQVSGLVNGGAGSNWLDYRALNSG